MNFSSFLTTIATLFVMLIVGYVAGKMGIIDSVASKKFSALIIKIAQPALIISSIVGVRYSPEMLTLGLKTLTLGFAVHLFMWGIAFVACCKIKNVDERKILEFSMVFGNTGFIGTTRLSKVDIENKNYEILIMLTYCDDTSAVEDKDKNAMNKKTVTTNRYVCNGRYTALKPGTDKAPMRTDSEKLNKVFEEGQLLVYRDDVDMYIYQYENEIYWVAGKSFNFEEDGLTYIQYHLDTTRVDLLPENRVNANKYWDSLRFVFESAECLDEGFYPYRVAVQSIPSEYPVTCFWTGYQIENNWVWREFLNLDIRKISNGFE